MTVLQISPSQEIAYLDPNPGGSPGILFIHGLGATGTSWALQLPDVIEAGYRPIAPDMRGFGQSSYPGQMSARTMADDCKALLEHLNCIPAHIVGISMGGVIAQQIAISYPEIVNKLVLVNTFHRLRPKSPLHWGYYAYRYLRLQFRGLKSQAHVVAQRIFPHPEQDQLRQELIDQVSQADTSAYRAAMIMLARFNSRTHLKRIHSPTLIITGEYDTTVDPAIQAKLAQSIPSGKQIIVPGAGHAVTVDHAEQFNRILLEFLTSA